MQSKFLVTFLLVGAFCEGQSSLNTPVQPAQDLQDSSSTPGIGQMRMPQAPPIQSGGIPNLGNSTSISGVSVPPGQAPVPVPPRIVGPLTTVSDFEQFAEDVTGHRLSVYGRQLFDEVPTTFAPVDNVPVPADYVLGPGDELLIRAWGKIDIDSRATVDRNGQIYLPRVGTLSVAGLRYEQVEGYLRSAIGAMFKGFELNVALGQLRSMEIFVLGNARQPGGYTVSSLSTLVNALFTSGGPSATGTMRHIQLRRANRVVSEFDIYDLAQKGDKSHDVQLLPGDVIFIPPVGAQVAISGNVNNPGIYELKGSTTIAEALDGAGGLTSLARAERVLLERIDNHSSRRAEELSLDAAGMQKALKDGDLLRIYPLSPKFENSVILRGSVALPGRYAWKEGMRISDLIPSRDSLISRDFWNRQSQLIPEDTDHQFGDPDIARYRGPDTDQNGNPRTDRLGNPVANQYGNSAYDQNGNPRIDRYADQRDPQYANSGADQSGNSSSYQPSGSRAGQSAGSRLGQSANGSTGQFANPGAGQFASQDSGQSGNKGNNQPGTSSTEAIDAVGRNSAEINWEYAVIERLDVHDLSTRLIPFRLAGAIEDSASSENKALKPGDVVTIFSRADLDLPMEKHSAFVRIGGEVNAPGVYRVEPGETLRDVVKQAGGITPHSYLYASLFARVSTRRAQEAELQQSTAQMQQELSARFANAPPVPGQTGADLQAELAMQQSAIGKLSSIKPTGRIVLEIKPDAATLEDIPDFPLEDGDAFYVPPRLSTVQVAGAVYNASAFRHEPSKRLEAYLSEAGGATRDADRKRIFVIRADGTVVSRQAHANQGHGSFEKLRLLPGDAIIVPERIRVTSKMADMLQVTQFASQTALMAAALSVVK
jgi:protein involved in polysaccharide export with SLBB domain